MRARDLVGKKVVAVRQVRWTMDQGAHTPGHVLDAIEFADGTVLVFSVTEGESDYGVVGHVYKRRKGEPWKASARS